MTIRTSVLLIVLLLIVCLCPYAIAQDQDSVKIELTYPNGKSPKVFTVGWTFGAKATLNPGTKGAKDLSKQVKWSGSGIFSPTTGAVSHPAFSQVGNNTIELTVVVNKKKYSEKFAVSSVKPNHAVVGDNAAVIGDTHGCPACPHPVCFGPILTGNSKVKIHGKAVACVGDTGRHTACCGPNTFKIISGDPDVKVDGRPVARLGDKTQHCGGMGKIATPNWSFSKVYVGKFSGGASGKASFSLPAGEIVGTFRGGHLTEGGGTVTVDLEGTYNPRNGIVKGTMKGKATYKAFENSTSTAPVKGTFKGLVKGNTFKGTWVATASGIIDKRVSGAFSTIRKGK